MLSQTESNVTFTQYELQFLGLKLSLEKKKVYCFILVHLIILVELSCATDLTNRTMHVNHSHYNFLYVGLHFFSSVLAER